MIPRIDAPSSHDFCTLALDHWYLVRDMQGATCFIFGASDTKLTSSSEDLRLWDPSEPLQ